MSRSSGAERFTQKEVKDQLGYVTSALDHSHHDFLLHSNERIVHHLSMIILM
jgi:hypothetical protein